MTDNWTFLVELCGDPPLAEHCTCLVDLSEEDDRGDIEVFKDRDGILHCTLGCECDGDGSETREITAVREYRESEQFNGKFTTFKLVSIVDFIRRLCDADTFDGDSEEEIVDRKRKLGV
jgi:hypothetical protein